MLVPLVVEEMCCGAGVLAGEQKRRTSTARWRSRSAQQILDVSVPFISELRFQRTAWEAEPLILKMTAEAVQSPVAQIVERGRRGASCHCWNASRTFHLNRSVTGACEGMTIAGSCTDQCHTASVLSSLTECAVISYGYPLEIEVANGTPAVDAECTFHPLWEQRLVGLTIRLKKKWSSPFLAALRNHWNHGRGRARVAQDVQGETRQNVSQHTETPLADHNFWE